MSRRAQEADRDGLVKAAGGLVWRGSRSGPRLAVIRRPKQGDWRLPKGKLKRGEDFAAAAVREVAEETGCTARLIEFAGYTLSAGKRRPKLVLFWHMAAGQGSRFEPSDEVDRVEWVTPQDALERIDHPEERRLLRSVRPSAVALHLER